MKATDEDEEGEDEMKKVLFATLSALSAGWALYLVKLHNDAVAHTLTPGVLCGEDAGCGDVMASAWSTVMGVPVSAPAVPMYLMLALLAVSGRLAPARLAGLATLCGSAGLAFGGWLLLHMLVDVGAVCNYCLVMDGLNLAVLLSGAALHPGGIGAAFAAIPAALRRLVGPTPEAALVAAVLVGAAAVHLALPTPQAPSEAEIAEAVADAVAAVTAPAAPVAPVGGEAEKTGETRRVVLMDTTVEFDLTDAVPTTGPADAPVTIVLFEDFQCPFCRQLAGNLHALIAQRPDDVRLAWYNFPMHTDCNPAAPKDMHPYACGAAAASVCAHQQGKFWQMHDTLFFNSAKLSATELRRYAAEIGLDTAAFSRCMDEPATMEKVRADAAIGSAAGVRGTPNFFVNGRKLSGALPVEVLEAVVDAVQEEAEGPVRLDVELLGELLGDVTAPATVSLQGPYGPFTIDAFEASIVDGVAVSQPGVEPAREVSWYEATAACEAAGKRLCTEEEWLSACTGELPEDTDGDGLYSDDRIRGRRHPYGEYPQPTWCASSREKDDARPLITGNHPRCVTPEGVYDLEGVTKEWIGLSPDRAGVKGGSYYSRSSARCGYLKDNLPPDGGDGSIGFRCCQGAAPPTAGAERYPGGKVGDRIQDWSLPTIDGATLGTDALRGEPFVMTFWASWCGPCRKELPALAALQSRYPDLKVVAVNIDQDPARARAYLKTNPLPFPVVMDTDSALMNRFDAQSVPSTFWVTAAGVIRQKSTGYDDSKQAELEDAVRHLLGQ